MVPTTSKVSEQFEPVREFLAGVGPLIHFRGSLDDSLSSSPEYTDDQLALVIEYAHLHERYPDAVRRRVLSETYRAKAEREMELANWSPEAIRAYGLSAYHAQIDRPMKVVDFALSTLGSPGIRLAQQLRAVVNERLT